MIKARGVSLSTSSSSYFGGDKFVISSAALAGGALWQAPLRVHQPRDHGRQSCGCADFVFFPKGSGDLPEGYPGELEKVELDSFQQAIDMYKTKSTQDHLQTCWITVFYMGNVSLNLGAWEEQEQEQEGDSDAEAEADGAEEDDGAKEDDAAKGDDDDASYLPEKHTVEEAAGTKEAAKAVDKDGDEGGVSGAGGD